MGYSLLDKVITSHNDTTHKDYKLLTYSIRPEGLLDSGPQYIPTHGSIDLTPPTNNSPAFKALRYFTQINGQAYICYAYAALKYDSVAKDWGDDGVIHILNGQSTMLDDNGHNVQVGTAQTVEPLGWIQRAS